MPQKKTTTQNVSYPGPPGYIPPQQAQGGLNWMGPPAMNPSPPQPPRPPGTDIPLPGPAPPVPPQAPSGGMAPPGQRSFEFGAGGGGFGQPGGQIGPPTQEQARQQSWGNYGFTDDYLKYLDAIGLGFMNTPDTFISDQQLYGTYPGLNQPAPFPRAPGSGGQRQPNIYEPAGAGGSGLPGVPAPQGRGIRGPSGGGARQRNLAPNMPRMPQMPMGGGMPGFTPRPVPPPTMTGPYAGSGSFNPIMPPGTNPWDIPGAKSGGDYIMPPGTPLPPGGEDIAGRIETDRRSIEAAKDAYRKYIAGGGDPYGPAAADWMRGSYLA